MRVTEDELLLAAHYGFPARLSDVVAASLTYQRDKRAHDRLSAEARETAAVVATARRLADRLPPNLDLVALAEAQDRRAHRELERTAERLRASTDLFFDTVGGAVPHVVAAMETAGWALDRPRLLDALRDRAGLGAELSDAA
jgi:regulator of protease activity HflC (stomatin/prohibitin superfamily)